MSSMPGLGRFVNRREERTVDVCELCGAQLLEPHRHVVDLEARTLCCACEPCSMLFKLAGSGGGRFRTVLDRILADPGLELSAEEWTEHTGIPVQLAFVFWSSAIERWVATFPSPAGPTEAELEPDVFSALEDVSPLFSAIEPDIEALLVRRKIGERNLECFVVPIDVCYRLVALVREMWSGFSGGDAAHGAIDRMFEEIARRSRTIPRGSK